MLVLGRILFRNKNDRLDLFEPLNSISEIVGFVVEDTCSNIGVKGGVSNEDGEGFFGDNLESGNVSKKAGDGIVFANDLNSVDATFKRRNNDMESIELTGEDKIRVEGMRGVVIDDIDKAITDVSLFVQDRRGHGRHQSRDQVNNLSNIVVPKKHKFAIRAVWASIESA